MDRPVVVNGRFLARRVTGVERCAAETLAALAHPFQVVQPRRPWQGLRGHLWEQLILPARVSPGAVLFSPANTGPLALSNQVLAIADLSPLEHPEWFRPAFSAWYRLLWPLLVRRASRVVTYSAHVRRKLLERFGLPPARVIQVPAGVNLDCFRPQPAPSSPGRAVLFVGSLEPRKNLPLLLQAWNAIKRRHPEVTLQIAGARSPVFQDPRLPAALDQVTYLGYVPERELPALYAAAEVLVLPSLDEGFGLPVLEAMACGTPVIASRAGALPEVVGDAGLLFDPHDAAGLAAILNHCLIDPDLRQFLRRRGLARARLYPWSAAARKIWQVLQETDE